MDSKSSFNYIFLEDDLSEVIFGIVKSGVKYSTCHEFWHLLLDIFARGELPDHYEKINMLCINRSMSRKNNVSKMNLNFGIKTLWG